MKDIDDIEILDLSVKEEVKEIKKEVIVKEDTPKKTKKRLKKKPVKIIQLIFCCLSFVFIMGCLVFYGSRFIKYYRIYNPKVDSSDGSVLLSNHITGNSEIVYEGSGLYITSGNYIYKGEVSDNYLKFNNMLWRIMRINIDNTIEIILDDYLNMLPYGEASNFTNSEILKYLEENVLKNIDNEMLVKMNYCTDKVDSLSNITCVNTESNYIKLLDVTSFLNTVKDKKTYLVQDDEIFWLSDVGTDIVWHTNGSNVSSSKATSFYEIRPVLKLKGSVTFTKGEGTKDKPYEVNGSNEVSLGSKVQLGDDMWVVYDLSDNIKLMSENVLTDKRSYDNNNLKFNIDNEDSLGKYLNSTYYDSLSYKNKLIKTNWYIGEYKNKLSDIKEDKIESYVSIPSMLDVKLDSSVNGYFTTTYNNDMLWVYENPLRVSRSSSERNIRVTIAISKDNLNKLKMDNNGIFKLEG